MITVIRPKKITFVIFMMKKTIKEFVDLYTMFLISKLVILVNHVILFYFLF